MLEGTFGEAKMLGRITFEKPPVVETVLGVEFPPIQGWGVQHFGLLWSRIRERFPKFEQQAPIIPVSSVPAIQFQLGSPPVRGWYIDRSETRVMQVQFDRFNYNWRERPGNERYPLYATLRPEFEAEWMHFLRFLQENDLAVPTPTQASVTYINHIPRGSGWSSANELGKIIKVWDSAKLPERLSHTQFVNLTNWKTVRRSDLMFSLDFVF